MKKQIVFGLLLLILPSCAPPTMDAFYRKYKNEGESERVVLPLTLLKPLTGLLPREEQKELSPLFGKLKSMTAISLTLKESSITCARNEMNKMARSKRFEEIMTLSEDDELLKIMLRKKGRTRKEVILLELSGNEVNILDFKVRIADSEIEKLLSETIDMHNKNHK